MNCLIVVYAVVGHCLSTQARPLAITDVPAADDMTLFDGAKIAPIFVETNANVAVVRAVNDLAEDFGRVNGTKAVIETQIAPDQ